MAGAEGEEWGKAKPPLWPRPLSRLPLLGAYTALLGLPLAAVLGNEAIFRYDSPLLWAQNIPCLLKMINMCWHYL